MIVKSLETASSRRRAVIVLLVLAVLSVPALVRATDPPKGSPNPLLRLNRGFNGPETKSRVAPPAARPLDAPQTDYADPPRRRSPRPVLNETLPDQPFDGRSDTLRGPPAIFRQA
jgi:hypothetical protein